MKINFDWNTGTNQTESRKNIRHSDEASLYRQNIHVDISGKMSDGFTYGALPETLDIGTQGINVREYMTNQRNHLTVMSNSMSEKDFAKMKEEGYSVNQMKPEEIVTILDTIKAELAKSGTHIEGYTDTMTSSELAKITGSSGYAEAIVHHLEQANAPITKENAETLDKVIHQALSVSKPADGNLSYFVSRQMEPTVANLYQTSYSSISSSYQGKMTGYASSGYSKYGLDMQQVRATEISKEELKNMEGMISDRLESCGMEANSQTIAEGLWLLERNIPITEESMNSLRELSSITFPLDINKVLEQASIAIAEGNDPFHTKLTKEAKSVYEKAEEYVRRYRNLPLEAADYVAEEKKTASLLHMEEYHLSIEVTRENIHARKTLEEVRLKMTVEANIKLIRSGYAIDTAPTNTST